MFPFLKRLGLGSDPPLTIPEGTVHDLLCQAGHSLASLRSGFPFLPGLGLGSCPPPAIPKVYHRDLGACHIASGYRCLSNSYRQRMFFHLRQNILRKIQSEGLQVQYQTNRDVELQARMIAAIAFVLLANVENAFESLQDTALNELEPIFNHFEDTYIGRPRRRNGRCNPMFPHSMWNMLAEWKKTFRERTTTSRDGIEK
ncbi:hypothetical protein E2C01_028263 [Portunus trituberculatus]|uniref:Uncharacterized protein n=1 Tax=Portunus trituberculatus TaxID=210409 RepID=A0A5B7EK08_PORTR|nr:hypothetical protein [Portunus trituberculatus]